MDGLLQFPEAARGFCQTESTSDACRHVVELVAKRRGVMPSAILSPTRSQLPIASSRQLAMYLCHVLLGMNLTEVGSYFGRDRTTVSYACALIEDSRECRKVDASIQELEDKINEHLQRSAAHMVLGTVGMTDARTYA